MHSSAKGIKLWVMIGFIVLIVFAMIHMKRNYSSTVVSTSSNSAVNRYEAWIQPEMLDWAKILHFIPNKTETDCLQLFKTTTSESIANTSTAYKNFLQVLSMIKTEGNRLQHLNHRPAPKHQKLSLTYQELAKQPWVQRVCEIGFDQGQSASAWLTAKDNLELHSFDIGFLPKTPYMAKLLKLRFKDRFNYHMGASDRIMPGWAEIMKGRCDIISIDGGHEFNTAYTDFIHMRKMAKKRHLIIADDILFPGVKQAWTLLKDLNIVTEQYRCHINKMDIDFVIGQYSSFFWDDN